MTDLQNLSRLKEKPFVTNCYMLENEMFDAEQSSYFDIQMSLELVCLYKNTKYNFKQMYFFVNQDQLLKRELFNWKEKYFVVENVTQIKLAKQNELITKWLCNNGIYHYRTF